MDCTVCCEKINKSNRKEIVCNYCDYSSCRICFQKYLTESIEDPHCMNCKKQFNREFLTNSCTSVFITTIFKEYRQTILFDREKALLIETQPYVIVEKEKIKMHEQISLLHKDVVKYESMIKIKRDQMTALYSRISNLNIDNSQDLVEENRKFIRKCPINDCRGFLSSRWKCGTCDTYICNKCNEIKDEDHTCNPENIATMDLLNKDTKPCPECATPIFRISGCPQMWCTNCNTPWDWNSGKKVAGTIHNPHYYDFVRNGGGGRNHEDIPCGGLPNLIEVRYMCSRLNIKNNTLYNIHNIITHIQNYEIREHRIPNFVTFNRNLRVSYILNKITEAEFKKTLQLNEKSVEKHREFNNIYQMFINVATDILRQIIVFNNGNSSHDSNEFIDTQMIILNNLVEYFNENIKKIAKSYKVVYPGISLPDYTFRQNYETFLARK